MKKQNVTTETAISSNGLLGAVFNENVEMDARMVLAGMRGGIDAIMNWGYMHRATFTTTSMISDRCEWLKKQSEEYITKVSARAAQLEREKIAP